MLNPAPAQLQRSLSFAFLSPDRTLIKLFPSGFLGNGGPELCLPANHWQMIPANEIIAKLNDLAILW